MKPSLVAAVTTFILMGCGRPTHTPQEDLSLQATSRSVFKNILSPRCVACHNPQGQARFLDLSSREAIWASRDREFGEDERLINPQSPEQSYLIKVIEDPIEPMPPRSSGLPQLTDQEISVMKDWIMEGLP